MTANKLIERVRSAAVTSCLINHYPVNIVEAHTLRGNLPKLDETPCICIGIDSFLYGEQMTEREMDGNTIIPGQRKRTGCANVGIYFEKHSKPKDIYNYFDVMCVGLFSFDTDKTIVSVEHGGVEYDRTFDALVLRGKVTATAVA